MDEDQIRRIMREELARAFKILAMEASDMDGHDTRELESAGLQAVAKAAERMERSVLEEYHGGRCIVRFGGACGDYCESNWKDD